MASRALGVLATLALTTAAAAQSTAFTYQGRLKNGSQLASGLHDFRFRLFDAASAGNQVGTTQCVDNILVTEGLFTSTIDFGQQFASPSPRFLEIEVRADTGLDCSNIGGFVVLAPRQALTAAPLASHARSAFSLDAADGSPQPAVFVDNAGKVGIGTTTPQANLDVRTADQGVRIQGASAGVNNTAYLTFANGAGTDLGYIGDGSSGDSSMYLTSYANDIHLFTAFGAALTAKSAGNIGIGTTTPAAKLDVRGNIKLGSTGQYSALGGQEDLRLIRGDIDGNGTVIRGTGFTVVRQSEGVYDVTFVPAFSGIPTVIATAVIGTGQPRWATNATFFQSSSTARIVMVTSGSATDSDWSLCVIGPR